ncbi:MAG: hypothetical protein MUC29_05680 [Pyrinomonadaceae bacterium]|jgi:hypothetical protein|nr:hypothetical protein [Pyrinomonadaceae bacterium]
MNWYLFDYGNTFGAKGSEGGIILKDEEHFLGSRITLEKCKNACFPITCGIYGWFFHTRFLSEAEANQDYGQMKIELDRILNLIPLGSDSDDGKMAKVSEEISKFVERFP